MDDPEYKKFILQFLNAADLGIKDIQKTSKPFDEMEFPPEMPKKLKKMLESSEVVELKTLHPKYDEGKNIINELYSLYDYNVRKDAIFSKDYIMGKYGAIPFISDIDSLMLP